MVLFPKSQVMMVCDGSKTKTARNPNYKITVGKSRKFQNNIRYGAFAEANEILSAEVVHISSFDDKLANELGYSTLDEYLANGWNSEHDSRKVIEWDEVNVFWDVVDKLNLKGGI